MKKIFLILAMILVSFTTNAQVYNYEYSYLGDGIHLCQTKDDNCYYYRESDILFPGNGYIFTFSLRACEAKPYLDIIFDLLELKMKFRILGKDLSTKIRDDKDYKLILLSSDNIPIQIQLSNGDILRIPNGTLFKNSLALLFTDSITVNNYCCPLKVEKRKIMCPQCR